MSSLLVTRVTPECCGKHGDLEDVGKTGTTMTGETAEGGAFKMLDIDEASALAGAALAPSE